MKMGCISQVDRNSEVDLECGGSMVCKEEMSGALVTSVTAHLKAFFPRISCTLSDGLSKCDEDVGSIMTRNGACEDYVKLEGEKAVDPEKLVKTKKKKSKIPPKPPRPPRSPSLDAADERLIKELSELAVLRRARIERIKALKKLKSANASSTSSNSSLLATVFTIFFCIVILFQGLSSNVDSLSPEGSPLSIGTTKGGGLVSVQLIRSSSAGDQRLESLPSPSSIYTAGSNPGNGLQSAAS